MFNQLKSNILFKFSAITVMELQPFDFESSLNSIGNFVQAVVSGQDEDKKMQLVEQLNHFLEIADPSSGARKRSKNFDPKVPEKKIKVDLKSVELPNEIWIKIMNYLPTNDILNSFGHVCRRFHGLIGDMKYLQAKIINLDMFDELIAVLEESKGIIALDLENVSKRIGNLKDDFINHIISLCGKLKSLRVSGNCDVNMDTISILKQFGPQFEHLCLEGIVTNEEVLIEISKMKFLKSLSLVNLKIQPFYQSVITFKVFQNLSINAIQLESINVVFQFSDSKVYEAFNQLIYDKRETLKKVRFANSKRVDCYGYWPCESYNNLNLCKNLQELSGSHVHEFQHTQSKLKRLLMTGKINSEELSALSKINLTNLEHLEIVLNVSNFCQFAQLEFPALKFLMIQLENWDESISLRLYTLMKNSPNLKALRFKGFGLPITISKDLKFKSFDSKGIIIGGKDRLQYDFKMAEYFLKNNKDYQLFEKYKELKTLYWKQFSDFQH